MAFWGCEVKPGRSTPFVPPPLDTKLHLSQACLNIKAKPGTKVALKVRVSDGGEQLLVCSLREGGTESVALDLIFDQYTEFSVEGGASIHLTGYYMPEYETMGSAGDSEDEEGGYLYGHGQLLGYDENGIPVLADEYDSEEDPDYESEDKEEDEEQNSDSDLNPPRRIVIEDVTESEQAKRQPKTLPAPQQANGTAATGKAAEFSDDDVSASDEEEEGGSEDEEGDLEEEDREGGESEEETEEEEDPRAQAAVAQHAGQKRKAGQPPSAAKQQPKQAKQQQGVATLAAAQQQRQQGAPATADKQQKQQKTEAPARAGKAKVRTFPNGFEIEDLKMGRPDGKLAKPGKKVVMRYVGRLKSNGKIFDQTKGNSTFSFRLGVGEVIKGWDRGVEGMRVGDKRRLTIPPAMAYGTAGVRGAIPGNATLVFEVELVDVK